MAAAVAAAAVMMLQGSAIINANESRDLPAHLQPYWLSDDIICYCGFYCWLIPASVCSGSDAQGSNDVILPGNTFNKGICSHQHINKPAGVGVIIIIIISRSYIPVGVCS